MTTGKYQPLPPTFFEIEYSRYDIVQTLGTEYNFEIFFALYKHYCMQTDMLNL